MKKANYKLEDIANITGLSIEEIDKKKKNGSSKIFWKNLIIYQFFCSQNFFNYKKLP